MEELKKEFGEKFVQYTDRESEPDGIYRFVRADATELWNWIAVNYLEKKG